MIRAEGSSALRIGVLTRCSQQWLSRQPLLPRCLSAVDSSVANSALIGQVQFKQGSSVRLTTKKAYDRENRLSSIVSTPSAGSGLSFANGYNPANQRVRCTLADGSFWLYEYDKLGQVVSGKRFWADGTPVAGQQFEYAMDDIGNRTSTKTGGDAAGGSLRNATYLPTLLNTYASRTVPGVIDVLGIGNVLGSVTVNDQTTARKGDYFHKALPVDNNSAARYESVTVKIVNQSSENSIPGKVFVPPATESYMYDGDGNLLSDGRWTYTWDAENRLIQLESLQSGPVESKRRLKFEYDHLGRRIRRQVFVWESSISDYPALPNIDVKFVYDGWNPLAEVNLSNGIIRYYLWGLDLSGTGGGAGGVGGLIGVRTSLGTMHFAVYDGNGNVVGLVDGSNGTSSARYEYGPFGESIRVTGEIAKANPFRWSTKSTDDDTDLVYYGYRYYNPSTGRWPSRDPIGEGGCANVYAFVKNNAVNGIDPFGLESFQFVVTTIIRPPDAEQGVKTKHVVVIDDYGTLKRVDRFMGYTDLIIEAPAGGGRLGESVTGYHPNVKVRMWGVAWSAVLGPLFNIDYDVTFDLNLCQRRGRLTGEHDTYPSYNVQGVGQELHDYTQKGNPAVELLGKGGVNISATEFGL